MKALEVPAALTEDPRGSEPFGIMAALAPTTQADHGTLSPTSQATGQYNCSPPPPFQLKMVRVGVGV